MRTDYTIIRGDTRTIDDIVLTDSAGVLPDLAGATADFQVEGLFTTACTLDESSGDCEVTIEPEDTESSPDQPTSWPYNVQLTLASGDIMTPQRGRLIILPDVDSV
jgi:hypothetical protein